MGKLTMCLPLRPAEALLKAGQPAEQGEAAQVREALCKVCCHNTCHLIQSMHGLNLKPKFYAVAYSRIQAERY